MRREVVRVVPSVLCLLLFGCKLLGNGRLVIQDVEEERNPRARKSTAGTSRRPTFSRHGRSLQQRASSGYWTIYYKCTFLKALRERDMVGVIGLVLLALTRAVRCDHCVDELHGCLFLEEYTGGCAYHQANSKSTGGRR